MKPCKTSHQINRGTSTTRGSDRNSLRKRRTALLVGASGVPKLTSNTPIDAERPCSKFDDDSKRGIVSLAVGRKSLCDSTKLAALALEDAYYIH